MAKHLKIIQFIMKRNLLLLKDLLESYRIKFTNIYKYCYKYYTDKLDEIIDWSEWSIDVKTSTYNDLMFKTLKKILYFKLVRKGYTPIAL